MVALRAFFPSARTLALTATAPKSVLQTIKKDLELTSALVVKVSPNRPNIFLQRKIRTSASNDDSYREILKPMADELYRQKGKYPLTIVYARLMCISKVVRLFRKSAGETNSNGLRRFAMYHSATEAHVKDLVLSELVKEDSFIRIVLATEALGMGVNTRNVRHIVHVTPGSSLETYFQEIGRAGRDGAPSTAILWFNNGDIADNRKTITDEMKDYCRAVGCLRSFILSHFGFLCQPQERCCSNCHPESPTHVTSINKRCTTMSFTTSRRRAGSSPE